ncbi:GNAT family N-acetyltransferase [Frateuria sp. Soil773]|uniref:GNAT family N-acetyltransferase n=1 Tax=Frateuria sp. Soil773 TaxID=1736407 RepID=UPI0009E7DBBF|nr:GNAT family N-acetyltransferase [Frateuria sp. Soil773]
MLTIRTYRYSELSKERRDQLRSLASNEFDQFPIVQQTNWATPDWSFLGIESQGQLACFYNLVERVVRFNDQPVKVVGLNNLVTAPDYKRLGLASHLLSSTEAQWFSVFNASYGLLLCANHLIPFYRRLGWQRVSSEVRFMQGERECVWGAECMVLSPLREVIDPAAIDLCGLPW